MHKSLQVSIEVEYAMNDNLDPLEICALQSISQLIIQCTLEYLNRNLTI